MVNENVQLKVYSHKTKFFSSIFSVLSSPVNFLKHNICVLFGRLKQYFACFDCSIFLCAILLLVYEPDRVTGTKLGGKCYQ